MWPNKRQHNIVMHYILKWLKWFLTTTIFFLNSTPKCCGSSSNNLIWLVNNHINYTQGFFNYLISVNISTAGNIIYVIFCGWCVALIYLFVAFFMMLTIIGIGYCKFCFYVEHILIFTPSYV